MPTRTDSLGSRIRLHLLDNPGPKSATALADALKAPEGWDRATWTTAVATECGRMARKGKLLRERTAENPKGPGTTYALPPS